MKIFLDAVVTALPPATPLWLILTVIFVVAGLAGTVGFLLFRLLSSDVREEADPENKLPPEHL